MSSKIPDDKQQQRVEEELNLLKISYEKKAKELIQSNLLLQKEILERKKVEKEILEITQEEQRRFGSQLHDGLCQELTAILVFAKNLIQKMEKEKNLQVAELTKISDMLLEAVDQARDTARGLYPGELQGTTLMNSLEDLASRTSTASCQFYCPEPIIIEDNNIATHLYRIAQEGISNAAKHGNAKKIELSFIQNKNNIILTIKDDGIGIKEETQSTKGIGLKIMKYRAHLINALFEVKPNFPQGTILECILKKPEKEKEIP